MNNSKSIIIAGVLLNFLAIAFAVTAYLSTQNQTLKSQATGSSSFTSAEAENATLSGPVVVGNDSAASNGRYIAFSSSTNPTATPLPTTIPTTGPSPTPFNGNVKVLCDGKIYDRYTDKEAVVIGKNADDWDPNIQKIVRNCTFRNSSIPAIKLLSGRNVLIEGNTFENIRTNQPGIGVHAISVPCYSDCTSSHPVDDIIVRNNTFRDIGADGIQMGDGGPYVSNFIIENNTFYGSDAVGENAVDIKGVNGPIMVRGNTMRGFRPCESPKRGGNQDCSGSPGEGMVIHTGHTGIVPQKVTVEGNNIIDNIFGLSIGGGNLITIRNNTFADNKDSGVLVSAGTNISLSGNTYSNNGTNCQFKVSGLTCQ